nr:DDE-type integrase/transposase/recombinase [Sulfitobacter algicola]
MRRARVDWHVDETNIRVGGKWRYLWRAADANGQMIDFRLTAREIFCESKVLPLSYIL